MPTNSFGHLSKMKVFMVMAFFAPLFFSGAVSGRHNFNIHSSKTAPAPSQQQNCHCPCACTDTSSNTLSPVPQPPSTPRASELYNFTASDICSTTNVTVGSTRFRNEVGLDFMIEAMKEAVDFIFKVFQQENVSDRKHGLMTKVHIDVQDTLDAAAGYYSWDFETDTQIIYVGADFVDAFSSEVAKDRVRALIYHEMTHAWQWYWNESSPNPPAGLFEGIADYMPLTAGLSIFNEWAAPGVGVKWDEGYDVTAWFLTYCDSLMPGFVAALNKMMKYTYNDNYFEVLLGKPVEELWRDYKNTFGHTYYVRADVRW